MMSSILTRCPSDPAKKGHESQSSLQFEFAGFLGSIERNFPRNTRILSQASSDKLSSNAAFKQSTRASAIHAEGPGKSLKPEQTKQPKSNSAIRSGCGRHALMKSLNSEPTGISDNHCSRYCNLSGCQVEAL